MKYRQKHTCFSSVHLCISRFLRKIKLQKRGNKIKSKFIEDSITVIIDPQARSTKQNKTVKKQMEVLMLNEEFLTEALTGENKKKFLDFVNAWSIVNGESNLDSFIMGFQLGANFTYDTFVSTEAPFNEFAEGVKDMTKKYYIALDDYERGTIINCLNEKRNKLIADGKYTDAVDEVLLKILNAKQKKFKVIYKEA